MWLATRGSGEKMCGQGTGLNPICGSGVARFNYHESMEPGKHVSLSSMFSLHFELGSCFFQKCEMLDRVAMPPLPQKFSWLGMSHVDVGQRHSTFRGRPMRLTSSLTYCIRSPEVLGVRSMMPCELGWYILRVGGSSGLGLVPSPWSLQLGMFERRSRVEGLGAVYPVVLDDCEVIILSLWSRLAMPRFELHRTGQRKPLLKVALPLPVFSAAASSLKGQCLIVS